MLIGCASKAPANGPGALLIAQFTLAQGAIGVPYRQLLIASGGVQPYTWSIGSGALPGGLTVTPDGIISGTPSADPTRIDRPIPAAGIRRRQWLADLLRP